MSAKKAAVENLTLEERVKQRLDSLRAERDDFIVQANKQIAAYNGAIMALEELVRPPVSPHPPTPSPASQEKGSDRADKGD